jgi:hypothetical protein
MTIPQSYAISAQAASTPVSCGTRARISHSPCGGSLRTSQPLTRRWLVCGGVPSLTAHKMDMHNALSDH